MKLRRKEFCPSIDPCIAVVASQSRRKAGSAVLVCSGSKTRITPEGIANSARRRRCGSC
jgi:hypothetical protein